ncbi:MAG TPA: RNA polymerase sigma factor [Solirubrobacteraceae bacterium]|nr:RNA polymerase sigma factor [Solirubrobacteraceae bacterium]
MSPRFSIRPLSAQPDARLAELAATGEERAFETLARRHRRALARYCVRIGVPEHRVDDVLQHSLTKAWLSLSGGAQVREPRAWLYRIVHNASINSIRSARRHAHDPLDSLPLALVPSTGEEPGLALRARDALGHVAALPEMQREAIVMTAIEGRSHEETAGLLGISDGAVRGLVHRARTTLRSAAAALTPQGLLGLLARLGGDAPLAERSAEISAGGAAAGATGLLAKGAVVTAIAGLLAAGGSISHVGGGHRSHARTPAASPAFAPAMPRGAVGGASASTSVSGDSSTRSRGRVGSGHRGSASHERGEHHAGRGKGGGLSGRGADGASSLGARTAPATADVDRSSDGDRTGSKGGRTSSSEGGSGGSASSGRDGGRSSQAATEVDDSSADAGQVSIEDSSGGSSGKDSGSGVGQSIDTGSGGSSGGSGQAGGEVDTDADGSGRGGPQASRIPG